MSTFDFSELSLSEEPAAELLGALGWSCAESAALDAQPEGAGMCC